jgi:tRNA (guanine37-N1)-methyltransferase
LRKRLRGKLATSTSVELKQVYNPFDTIGDVAITKTPETNSPNAERVARKIMATHKNIRAVFAQTSPIQGNFRLRKLALLAGEFKTTTNYKETGCVFNVDLENCYFSPRLVYERSRIASAVKIGETVVNMFAGVGCFSVIIAKNVPGVKVYSIDINPSAFGCMQKNIKVNRVYGKVFPMLGDAKSIVQAQLQSVADRVLMPLPEKALEYLPVAVSALKRSGGWIHYYDFEHAIGNEVPVHKTEVKVAAKLDEMGLNYAFAFGRVVRSTGPNWYQTVLDIQVIGPKQVLIAQPPSMFNRGTINEA